MADIGTAYVKIEPTAQGISGKIEKELGGAGTSGGKAFSAGFGKVLGSTGAVVAGAAALGGAAIAAMGTQFIKASSDVADYGDNIDKMSQKMGLTASAYQEWDAVMQHSGTSMETMKASMKTLASAAESNNKAFEALGITQEELATMNQQDLFEATIKALQEVESDTQRTYLAGQLLGRGATELGALLNTSAEETQAMRDRVRELGGVMSDEAVKASAAFKDQLQDMQTAFTGLSRNLMGEFLPQITMVMAGLTEIFTGNSEGGLSQISQGINNIANSIMQALPQVVDVASGILQALANAVISNLPMIANVGLNVISELTNGLMQALPTLLPIGIQIVVELANSIAQSAPVMIPQITSLVLQLADMIANNADLLIDSATALMLGLSDGLVLAIPVLTEKAPEIILKLAEALILNLPQIMSVGPQVCISLATGIVKGWGSLFKAGADMVNKLGEGMKNVDVAQWGKDMIDNFIAGIKARMGKLVDAVKDVAGTVKDYIGFSEPKKGELSNFHTFAPDMMELFAQGIKENENIVSRQMQESLSIPQAQAAPQTSNSNSVNATLNIYGTEGQDVNELADVVMDKINSLIYKQGAVYA